MSSWTHGSEVHIHTCTCTHTFIQWNDLIIFFTGKVYSPGAQGAASSSNGCTCQVCLLKISIAKGCSPILAGHLAQSRVKLLRELLAKNFFVVGPRPQHVFATPINLSRPHLLKRMDFDSLPVSAPEQEATGPRFVGIQFCQEWWEERSQWQSNLI